MGLFDIFKKKKVDQENQSAEVDQQTTPESAPSESEKQVTDADQNQPAEKNANVAATDQQAQPVAKDAADTHVSATAGHDEAKHEPAEVVTENGKDEPDGDQAVATGHNQDQGQKQDQNEDQHQDEQSNQEVYDRGLKQSRNGFAERFNRFLANFRSVDENFFEELEDTLIGADLGFDLAIQISNQVREAVKVQNIKDKDQIRSLIIEQMVAQYDAQGQNEDQSMHFAPAGQPTVILFVGVNGVGKTTTVGKLASTYKKEGKKVLLAAADTFRAGAVKQLQEWGNRADVPVVAGPEKADPASVVYTAVERAKEEHYDVLFVDTAGRLQNNVNLMQELSKINRVVKKVLPDAPQEVLLVLDATTGQNALQQAKLFQDSSDVTGIVLTKMDGTAKGGIVFAIRDSLHLPVKWIGFGEKATDLRVFSAEDFVYGMFKDLV
ncbi:signal recognition particle-docking protein FtsY [Fructobacillus tropaeoli]|uniref:Signal recognition particle receptor FtsY n=1 Tax=Fructobacillus tropaeoli TaxID=709323 RepID=A0ABN9YT56_9LACO|nr:signal recognition particle-docking protein FtsY [Fructobacillus tropaeoli]GIC69689.1 signal recognition particle-docking protein FtsY [Fructobacillus tropaeoli]CAK1234480.1 Signal recognition particle GTPase FtsY (FtsY) [Fructobacillus tropaeoli]CAK1235604.1 Signal recognition particle GTPase FtsY (FtsY) [Fructobacillus tropaeoli]CAK1238035.1 Signal recognition particle GTPase FtsY (FtsY) [Fructobacillus tropaeoli]